MADGSTFGGKAGNEHFFFLPPIVPSPDYQGTFDASLLPYLSVQVAGPFANDLAATCASPSWTFRQADGLAVSPDQEQYSYGWKTGDFPLQQGQVYRVCVVLGVPNADAITLGFRDVSPTQGGGSVAEDPVYLFNNGSNLAIKFRVEEGVLSDAFCADDPDAGDPNGYDCTAAILASNESAYCDNNTCALTAGQFTGSELFVVEKFGLGDAECTEQGVTSWLDVHIPQYAGCVRVTVPNGGFVGFDTQGTVGACFYETSGPNPLKLDQDESIQLHIQYPDATTPPTVWALPWEYAGIEGTCEFAWEELAPSQATSASDRMVRFAKRTLRKAQLALNPWFAPAKAHAFHTGFGGHTTLRSTEPTSTTTTTTSSLRADDGVDAVATEQVTTVVANAEGGPQVYLLAWALPSQMDGTASSGTQTVAPGGTLIVDEGSPVMVNVLVTDNGAAGTPRVAALEGRPVQGAQVHFALDNGTPTPVPSDENGLASFPWQALGGGLHTITASGFGIGTDETGGPFDSFDDDLTYNDLPALLGTGTLDFNVYVCDASMTPNIVDGTVASGEYPFSTPFTAKVSGGATSARLYWAYDCGKLYFALEVAADDELANEIVLVFDNDGDGTAELGDDVWSLLKNTKTGQFTIADRYLTTKCLGSKQASCGADDTADGGSNDLSGGQISYDAAKGVTVYEIAHPLTGDAAHDIQVNLSQGTTLGVYVVLQMGSGAQGNTQWPGFRVYQPITIGPLQ